jgi:hypothetical protein
MKHICKNCGSAYDLEPSGFHLCPYCVLSKMTYPYGVTPKHTISRAPAHGPGTSFISDNINGEQIFNFLTRSIHSAQTGSEFVRSTNYNTVNAICHMPLGEIPGSGITTTGDQPAVFAVLYDLEGKSNTGPHFAFFTERQIAAQLSTDWVRLPMCGKCNKITVFQPGDVCANCTASASAAQTP